MLRLLPFFLCFVVGLFAGWILFYRRAASAGSGSASEWERKYRNMEQRFRELSRDISNRQPTATERQVGIYRSLLHDAAHILQDTDRATSRDIESTLRAIRSALDDDA